MPRRGIDESLALSSDEGDEWWGGEGETSARAASSARHVIAPLARLVDADERLEDRRAMVKSVAAVKQAFKEEQARAWEARWRAHPRGAGLREIAPQPPGAAFARYHAQLPRRQSSLLARLRLDFIGLNRHKQRIQRHPNGLCDCGAAIETRAHFLLECTLHAAPRAALLRELHLRTMPPLERLLSDPARARPLLRFINSTDRFPRLYEVVDAAQDGTRPAPPPCCGVLTADGLVKGGEKLPKAVSALWQQHKAEECARWEQEWAAARASRTARAHCLRA
ncbi:hypothetical protein JCM10449v2_005140 [Rhodotorula kratochvilovae]